MLEVRHGNLLDALRVQTAPCECSAVDCCLLLLYFVIIIIIIVIIMIIIIIKMIIITIIITIIIITKRGKSSTQQESQYPTESRTRDHAIYTPQDKLTDQR